MPSRCAREWQVASSSSTLLPIIVCGRVTVRNSIDSNVEGTRNILQAARDSGIRRVIYTSSVATMGFGNNGHLTDEASPVNLDNMIGDYKRSKFMAERLVIEAATGRAERRDGESDDADRGTRHQADAYWTDRGGFSEEKISGLCRYRTEPGGCYRLRRGHLLAMEKARPGERYILGGENLTLKEILDKLAAITGLPSPG